MFTIGQLFRSQTGNLFQVTKVNKSSVRGDWFTSDGKRTGDGSMTFGQLRKLEEVKS